MSPESPESLSWVPLGSGAKRDALQKDSIGYNLAKFTHKMNSALEEPILAFGHWGFGYCGVGSCFWTDAGHVPACDWPDLALVRLTCPQQITKSRIAVPVNETAVSAGSLAFNTIA